MNIDWDRIAEYLSRRRTPGGSLTGEALLEQLYIAYAEETGADPPEIREQFALVERALIPVSPELSDQLVTLICRLCSLHQETAFLDGVALGFQLHAALRHRIR